MSSERASERVSEPQRQRMYPPTINSSWSPIQLQTRVVVRASPSDRGGHFPTQYSMLAIRSWSNQASMSPNQAFRNSHFDCPGQETTGDGGDIGRTLVRLQYLATSYRCTAPTALGSEIPLRRRIIIIFHASPFPQHLSEPWKFPGQ